MSTGTEAVGPGMVHNCDNWEVGGDRAEEVGW